MSEINPYTYYTNVTIDLLMENINTLHVQNNTLNLLTETNQNLTDNWNSAMPDPNSQMWKDFENIKTNADMANFIQTYMTGGAQYLSQFSSAFGIAVMTKLSQSGVWDDTKGPSQMNEINQYLSLVSSTAQNDESTGQNEVKTQNSQTQQSAGNQQPLSDGANAVQEANANIGSLLGQSY